MEIKELLTLVEQRAAYWASAAVAEKIALTARGGGDASELLPLKLAQARHEIYAEIAELLSK